MEFWLSFNNGAEKLQLPVNPSGYDVSRSAQNTTVNINEIGEANLLGKKGLASFPLVSFFPRKYEPYCKYSNFPSPEECIKLIESWWGSGKPIRLRITETNINTPVSIESFTYGQSGGSGNVNFSLELKEYRFLSTENNAVVLKRNVKTSPKTYVVKEGDTLQTIAKKTTGNSSNWPSIAKANNIKNGKLTLYQKLVIL